MQEHFQCSWMTEPFNAPPERVLRKYGKDCDEVWAYAIISKSRLDPYDGIMESCAFMKRAGDPCVPWRREAEAFGVWHLPGIAVVEQTVLWRLWSHCWSTLGVGISKFTSVVHREIMTIDDAEDIERKILILTFATECTNPESAQLTSTRYRSLFWADIYDLSSPNFVIRGGNGTFRRSLLKHLEHISEHETPAEKASDVAHAMWQRAVHLYRYKLFK
ncbi:hypothetical protein GGR50DRAFT_694606 [Xylaria sp. CBS 124048]|nr:hypothetical protein GGR50DRAFT_694606 [Xylaria sp. CBS 124048]